MRDSVVEVSRLVGRKRPSYIGRYAFVSESGHAKDGERWQVAIAAGPEPEEAPTEIPNLESMPA